jgi:phospholipid transport system transporter-binding protein
MSKARLEALGRGRFRLCGVLDAEAVVDVLEQSLERFQGEAEISVDLAGVAEADSAGLALLIEWLRVARQRSQRIQFANMPAQINALARISEVEDLLAANGAAAPSVEATR